MAQLHRGLCWVEDSFRFKNRKTELQIDSEDSGSKASIGETTSVTKSKLELIIGRLSV